LRDLLCKIPISALFSFRQIGLPALGEEVKEDRPVALTKEKDSPKTG